MVSATPWYRSAASVDRRRELIPGSMEREEGLDRDRSDRRTRVVQRHFDSNHFKGDRRSDRCGAVDSGGPSTVPGSRTVPGPSSASLAGLGRPGSTCAIWLSDSMPSAMTAADDDLPRLFYTGLCNRRETQ